MKQDQSYFGQVFYLREDNFGLNKKKNVYLKFLIKLLHYLPKIILQNHTFPPINIFTRPWIELLQNKC